MLHWCVQRAVFITSWAVLLILPKANSVCAVSRQELADVLTWITKKSLPRLIDSAPSYRKSKAHQGHSGNNTNWVSTPTSTWPRFTLGWMVTAGQRVCWWIISNSAVTFSRPRYSGKTEKNIFFPYVAHKKKKPTNRSWISWHPN